MPSDAIRDEGRVASAWVLSIVGHWRRVRASAGLVLAGSLGDAPRGAAGRVRAPPVPADDTVEIDLPRWSTAALLGERRRRPRRCPRCRSRAAEARGSRGPTRVSAGRGGTDTADAAGAQPRRSRRGDGALARDAHRASIAARSSASAARAERASREDWRASREPMELTFLASGRSVTDRAPSGARRRSAILRPGARRQRRAAAAGRRARRGRAAAPASGESAREAGGPIEGAARASAGVGVRDGAPGEDHRDSAERRPGAADGAARARPASPRTCRASRATTRQRARGGARRCSRSSTRATPAARPGRAPAGRPARGRAGSGGTAGARLDVARARHRRRARARRRPARQAAHRLHAAGASEDRPALAPTRSPLWARGRGRAAASSSSTVHHPRRRQRRQRQLTRPSGIPEFDENCRARPSSRAAPFEPLPPELGSRATAGRCPSMSENPVRAARRARSRKPGRNRAPPTVRPARLDDRAHAG